MNIKILAVLLALIAVCWGRVFGHQYFFQVPEKWEMRTPEEMAKAEQMKREAEARMKEM